MRTRTWMDVSGACAAYFLVALFLALLTPKAEAERLEVLDYKPVNGSNVCFLASGRESLRSTFGQFAPYPHCGPSWKNGLQAQSRPPIRTRSRPKRVQYVYDI